MGIIDALEGLIRGRREPPIRPTPGLGTNLPPIDDDFVSTLDPLPVDIDGVTIGIEYKDASGRPSTRTIRCRQALRDGSFVYLHAWCLQREDWRTFRLDRIVEIFDHTSGEVVGSPLTFFTELLGLDLVDPAADKAAIVHFRDGARVLLYVAMTDGHLHSSEADLIVKFVVERLQTSDTSHGNPDRVARLWIQNQVPSRQSALRATRKLATDEAYCGQVADYLFEVMLADGHVTDDELDAVRTIVKALERADQKQKNKSQ